MPLYQYRTRDGETTFLFIHVPKTGGTAIEAFFQGLGLGSYFDPPGYRPLRPYLRVPPAHYDYGFLSRLVSLDRLYSFAVVRHPVARMISEYKWALEKTTLAGPMGHMEFGPFIRRMFEQYGRDENTMGGHFKPQVRFVGENVTKIFKYETGLDKIVGRVLQDVGLASQGEPKLPVVNVSSTRKVVPEPGDIALIREFYAEDFEAFGYDAEPEGKDATA